MITLHVSGIEISLVSTVHGDTEVHSDNYTVMSVQQGNEEY